MNKKDISYKLAISGILIAIATIFGTFSIPIFGAKMSPVQHFVNVVAAVVLGPIYAVGNAFVSSFLRNILGTGSLLAFPGSMIGALLAGLAYQKFKKIEIAVLGEIIGTGLLGALVAYPIAKLVLGKEVALFVYIVPFSISCIGGAIIAYILLKVPSIRKTLLLRGGR
ncbi:energy coupling factor transporter S component ThiW [Clostridium sp. LP20]|uniref:energy coupling factor transporter S component ThiW n=1 Tax=Clostridium sp. LP20 TaxID=3418665 RepID=UPI003EE62D84